MNLLSDIPQDTTREIFQTLLQAASVRIERIVSHGQSSPPDFWYDQDQAEWVLVLAGAARLQYEDRDCDLKPGDYLHIPARQRHRVAWTAPDEPTIWLAIYYDGP